MIVNLKRLCRIKYDLADDEEPTKAQVNTVTKMCRDGTLDAIKVGRQWLVNLEFKNERSEK